MSPYSAKTLTPRGWIHPEKRRPNSAARGYDRHWRKIRARILEQHPFCTAPGCNSPADTVDHKLSLSKGGTHDDANLQAFCRRCHSRKTVVIDNRWGK